MFYLAILTEILREAQHSPETWNMQGIRTLILYPMNALVSDQLGRIRNIIGKPDDAFMKVMDRYLKAQQEDLDLGCILEELLIQE